MAENPGTIPLGQGMVSFGPPPQAMDCLRAAVEDPAINAYGTVPGEPDLRRALAEKLRRENGIDVPMERLFVTSGSNMAFMQLVLALADPGDELVILTPFYFNHEMAIGIAGCRAVTVPTDPQHHPDVDAIEQAIGPKTRAVVTISPNNPTGAVYPQDSLEAINRLCAERGIVHVSDEAYEYFTWGGARHFSPASLPGADDHTVSLFSFSKAYGFAGYRVGYCVLPEFLVRPFRKIQDTNPICAPVISQRTALGALDAGADYCRGHLEALVDVRRNLLAELAELPFLRQVPRAEGAMYAFLDLDSDLGGLPLVTRLIQEHRVACLPGETFGTPEHGVGPTTLRVSYGALDPATASEGIGRLIGGLRSILG